MFVSKFKSVLKACLVLLCLSQLTIGVDSQEAPDRGVSVEPATESFSQGSSGLFIGINEFDETNLDPLSFAVNDAISQAYAFVEELKLIPAGRCWLGLSGKPNPGSKWERELEELKVAGVQLLTPNRLDILRKLADLADQTRDASDLLVVSVSSHGLQSRETGYFMAKNSHLGPFILENSGVPLKAVIDLLNSSKAGKSLLLLDACRNNVIRGERNVSGVSTDNTAKVFKQLFSASTGKVVLASCDEGQVSYEDARLGHGVFSYYLLQGIRGAAEPEDYYITLGGLSDYVSSQVSEWVFQNKRPTSDGAPQPRQDPWFRGPQVARSIPLAVSVQAKEDGLEGRKNIALDYLLAATSVRFQLAHRIESKVYEEVAEALGKTEGDQLEAILRALEDLKDADRFDRRNFTRFWEGERRALGFEDSRLPEISEPAEDKTADSVITEKRKPIDPQPQIEITELPTDANSIETIAAKNNIVESGEPPVLSKHEEQDAKNLHDSSESSKVTSNEDSGDELVLSQATESLLEILEGAEITADPKPITSSEISKEDFTVEGLGIKMVWIVPGTFWMGSEEGQGYSDEQPRHQVTIGEGFWLGKYEVTQGQWKSLKDSNPSLLHEQGLNAPVESVSWEDVQDFCKELNERELIAGRLPEGYEYRLPTEAQWEYACRAGTETEYSFGDFDRLLKYYAWYDGNSATGILFGRKQHTHPVGQKLPNLWGVYDMHGNVEEWCEDWFGDYPAGPVMDNGGPVSGSDRVTRGGSWPSNSNGCRSTYRRSNSPSVSYSFIGFRLSLRSASVR